MLSKIKIIITAGCLFALPILLTAQNNSSPYSVIGIGDIETSFFNRYTGMANAGVTLSDERYINNSNAASLTKLREHFYSFEMSSRLRQVVYSGAGVLAPNNKTTDFAVRRINLAARLTKNWGSSIGLMPFSTSAFNFIANKNIQGTLLNIPASYQGDGGVNQFYWANGVNIAKNISIGVTSSFLFGSLNQTEQILSSDLSTSLTTRNSIYLRNYYFNFAAQAKKQLTKKWLSTYGVTYSPKTSLMSQGTVNVTSNSITTINNIITNNNYFTLPETYNAGIALIKNNKYTYTVNGQFQNWNAVRNVGSNYQLVNSNKLSVGFQNSIRARNTYGQEFEKGFFQLGIYAGNSYIKMDNNQLTDFGASIGYARNSKVSALGYIISLEAGRRATKDASQLQENYINLNFTISYLDYLVGRKKYF